MTMLARWKSMAGGNGPPVTVASAATITLEDKDSCNYISGTTTVTSLLVSNKALYNRIHTFIGAAGAAVAFTNTNTPTTVGQMNLKGSNQTLQEDQVMQLFLKNDGTWILLNVPV